MKSLILWTKLRKIGARQRNTVPSTLPNFSGPCLACWFMVNTWWFFYDTLRVSGPTGPNLNPFGHRLVHQKNRLIKFNNKILSIELFPLSILTTLNLNYSYLIRFSMSLSKIIKLIKLVCVVRMWRRCFVLHVVLVDEWLGFLFHLLGYADWAC